jgi:2'-5' RNA ligase
VERFGFDLALDGVDQFGNHKPRAIFASVRANQALTELQAEQETPDEAGRAAAGRTQLQAPCDPGAVCATPRRAKSPSTFPFAVSTAARPSRYRASSCSPHAIRWAAAPYKLEAAYPLM